MKRLISVVISIVFILGLTLAAVPAGAAVIPDGANTASLFIQLTRDVKTYHVGEVVDYKVTINVPMAVGDIRPGQVINIQSSFTNPNGTVVNLPYIAVLNPGESVLFTKAEVPGLSYIIAEGDMEIVDGYQAVIASATANGTSQVSPLGDPATGTAEITTRVMVPEIEVTKSANPATAMRGDTVEFTITVSNTGDSALTRVSVSDKVAGYAASDISSFFPESLPVGGSSGPVVIQYTIPAGAPDPLPDTVTAIYEDASGFEVSDTDSAVVNLITPEILVMKTASPANACQGENVHFIVTVKNTGDIALTRTSVTDSLQGNISGYFSDTLAAGESEIYEYDYLFPEGSYTLKNTATAIYTVSGMSGEITGSDTVQVSCPTPPPVVGGEVAYDNPLGWLMPLAGIVFLLGAFGMVLAVRKRRSG